MRGTNVLCGAAVAWSIFAAPTLAAHINIYAPQYSEAVYGTDDAPLAWSTGPFVGVTSFHYGSHLHDAKIVTFDLANATPGARVDWYGQYLGDVAGDGTFSLNAPVIPMHDSWDRQFAARVRVGLYYGGSFLVAQPFDIVRMEIMGSKPIAAPEPTTWALMLLGFGAVGAMLREHRRLATEVGRLEL